MEEKAPPTSTASLAPGLRMFRNRQPDEHIQQYLPPFDELSVPNLTPQENGPIEPPGQTFSLAPGVGRPQRYDFIYDFFQNGNLILIVFPDSLREVDLNSQSFSIRRCLETMPVAFPSLLLTLDLMRECVLDKLKVRI